MDKSLHPFARAGLGKAPFRCVGCRECWFEMPGFGRKPGGSCDYCGTGILYEYVIQSKDGAEFVVGCDCVEKIGGDSNVEGFRAERLKFAREKRAVKASERRSKRQAAWEQERAASIADKRAAWHRDHAGLDARLKAYQGSNSFLQSMRIAVEQWGGLTVGQVAAVERSFAAMERLEQLREKSEHVGQIGKRMPFWGRVVFCKELQPGSFYPFPRRFLVKLESDDGNVIVWFGGRGYALSEVSEKWKATPKEHSDYDGVKQTVVSRLAPVDS